MKTRFHFILSLALLSAGPVFAENTTAVVEHLLNEVKTSGYTFLRNGQEHPAAEAADHMRKKYKHFKKKIATPEDFIHLAGTQSLMSKKPYRLRTRDGKEMATRDYLLERLKVYRESRPGSRGDGA